MITRAAFKKWTKITLLCGAHSFFWGATIGSSIPAMLLGLVTLITLFAFVESHPLYQSKRAAAPRLARALDAGVRFRMWFVGYVALSYLASIPFHSTFLMFIFLGHSLEIFIGIGAVSVANFVTGIQLDAGNDVARHGSESVAQAVSGVDQFVATYFTTIVTGVMHTIILAVICLIAYGVIRLREKNRASRTDK